MNARVEKLSTETFYLRTIFRLHICHSFSNSRSQWHLIMIVKNLHDDRIDHPLILIPILIRCKISIRIKTKKIIIQNHIDASKKELCKNEEKIKTIFLLRSSIF